MNESEKPKVPLDREGELSPVSLSQHDEKVTSTSGAGLPSRHSEVLELDEGSSNDDDEEQPRDLETLSRVSSGPPYTVFSRRMIYWIVAMNCVSAFISPITANIYFPAIPSIAKDLGVSIGEVNLSLTTYMIFQGLAPTFVGDFGDAAGRRPAFIVAFVIYLGANIGLALQRNYAALLVLRCLQSAGSSGTIALVYGVVADITTSSERGKYMGIVGAGLTIGPSLGPTIGGILTQYLGWPSVFWFCTILTVIWMIPYVLCVPETGRKVVGNGSIPPQPWNMTLLDYLRFRRQPRDRSSAHKQKIPIPNPFNTLAILGNKDMAMILLYNALLYVGFMIVAATLSTQFSAIYHYNELVLGLCYMPFGVACTISSVGQGFILDWNYRRTAAKINFKIDKKRGDNLKDFPIERVRIQVILPYIFMGAAVYIGYAWALQAEVHVAVPLVLSFFIGLCVTGSFQVMNTLIVDLYPESPATATAANNLVRCTFGAVSTAVIEDMISAMGRGWAFTLIALIFTVFSPALWIIQKHGPTWREERRQKMLKRKEKEEAEEKMKLEARVRNSGVIGTSDESR
ncbi:major facilitator superfamily domain-containing protein [Xylariales sp. AK1849]|nr:major facilitator superfamily domain-containing protein [Xylariales sp. AK1849]